MHAGSNAVSLKLDWKLPRVWNICTIFQLYQIQVCQMGVFWNICWVLHLLILRLSCLVNAQPFDYPMANLSTSWINNPSAPHSVDFTDGSTVRPILLRGSNGLRFACGFFCSGNCSTYLFAIFIVQTNISSGIPSSVRGPPLVWSANRSNLVQSNATLELTSDGDLVLRDVDGTLAWSTNTAGKSVAGLNLTDVGNLVLFDINNAIVWQSFDYPTDSLVPGQMLVEGQKLTSSVSILPRNSIQQQGLYSFSVTREGLFAFIESNPPQFYYENRYSVQKQSIGPSYARFLNGSLVWYEDSVDRSEPDALIDIPLALSAQFMRLGPDGHLRVYEWRIDVWIEVADIFQNYYLDECNYPMVCQQYGICSAGQCSCPASTSGQTIYFNPINDMELDLGCYEITPLSCGSSEDHSFIELKNTTYFAFNTALGQKALGFNSSNSVLYADPESCKQACSKNCSCKAAIYSNAYGGRCYLASQLFSLMSNEHQIMYSSTAYIKVQNAPSSATPSPIYPPPAPLAKNTSSTVIILGSTFGALFGQSIIIMIFVLLF